MVLVFIFLEVEIYTYKNLFFYYLIDKNQFLHQITTTISIFCLSLYLSIRFQ